tara:strand:+ start:435 stop:1193 length:759 start_codon:yes stop_codon:yes gene_type:complete
MQFSFVTKKINRENGTYSFVASTENSDRYGDVINQKGWSLEAYNRNPVVLLNHNSNSLPIGKGKVEIKDGQLMIDVEFDQEDELARKVESKVKNGYINAVSVGFNPIESKRRSELPKEHKAFGKRGMYFEKSELLEVSIVTIPANSDATAKQFNAIEKRISDLEESLAELKHILDVEVLEDGNFRITYASMSDDETEDLEEREMDSEDEDKIDEGYSPKDDDEEEKAHDEDHEDEDEMKSFLTALLKAYTTN